MTKGTTRPTTRKENNLIIRVKNLRLQTYIGIYDWEQEKRQNLVLNIEIEVDAQRVEKSDDVANTVDYNRTTQTIAEYVESKRFKLLEKLTAEVLDLVMKNPLALRASVEIDKPGALPLADSVSTFATRVRESD